MHLFFTWRTVNPIHSAITLFIICMAWFPTHSVSEEVCTLEKFAFRTVLLCCVVVWHMPIDLQDHITGTVIDIQYISRNMHTVFALLCFVVVIHWLIFPYPSGLLHWHCGNLTIAPVPAKQPWWIWINTSCEFIMNDCITTTKQSTTKPCAYFLGYTVRWPKCPQDNPEEYD